MKADTAETNESKRDATTDVSPVVTRRRAVGLVSAGVLSVVGVGKLGSDGARADVTLGDFEATGDAATLSDEPAAVPVSATGDWAVDGSTTPTMVECTLQVHIDGGADDLDRHAVFEGTESGTFDLSADVLDHRDIDASDLMPVDPGDTLVTEATIRVIVTAARNGSILSEAFVEDTATIEATREGVEVTVGGSATLSIDA